jgi:PadR family transcriptional regulator AphA
MRALTTNSYAILGLIGTRESWSTYELAKQLRRGVHQVIPRARSNIYAEPKRLAADGYLTAQARVVNGRGRTEYSITDKGRSALRAWLARPGGYSSIESPNLLRVWVGEQGTRRDLLAALEACRQEAIESLRDWDTVAREYVEYGTPFPGRIHVNALTFEFYRGYARLLLEWSQWAAAIVGRWPSAQEPDADWDPLSVFREAVRSGELGVDANPDKRGRRQTGE